MEARGGLQAFRRRGARGLVAVKAQCGAPSPGRSGDHGRRRTGGPATGRPMATRPGSPAAECWGTRTPPLPGWHLSAESLSSGGCHLPQGRLARCCLAGKEDLTPLACARVSVSVSSVCIPRVAAGSGEGQEETYVSDVWSLPAAPSNLKRQDGVWQSGLAGWGWM